jgi:hypothetical protein
VTVFKKATDILNLVTLSNPRGVMSQTGYLSAKRDIYQPDFSQLNFYQVNGGIFISQICIIQPNIYPSMPLGLPVSEN